MRYAYTILVRKPKGKRPLGRSRRKWEDNIKIDITEIGLEVVDWISVVQYRDRWWDLVNKALNLMVP
jgi:hypothetical protein